MVEVKTGIPNSLSTVKFGPVVVYLVADGVRGRLLAFWATVVMGALKGP